MHALPADARTSAPRSPARTSCSLVARARLYVRSFSSTRSHLFATSDERPARVHHAVRDLLVLDREARRARRARARRRAARSIASCARSDAVVLDPAHLRAAAHARRCRRTARGRAGPRRRPSPRLSRVVPGDLRDDAALLPDEPVEQARLPDVRPADDREPRLGRAGSVAARRVGQQRDDAVEQVARSPGRAARRPRTARRARAGGTRPRRRRPRSASALFATSSTGRRRARSRRASSASSSVIPACDVDDEQDQVGLGDGSLGLLGRERLDAAGAAAGTRPCRPGRTRRPRHVASSSSRSRVTPGVSCAIAARRPNSRFTRVDFPTFCRPTTAIAGCALTSHAPASARGRRRAPRRGSRRSSSSRRVDHDRVRRRVERVRPRVARVARRERARRSSDASRSARSRARRVVRSAPSATRKSFTGASGNTTRRRCRDPPSPRPRCAERRAAARASVRGRPGGARPPRRSPRPRGS